MKILASSLSLILLASPAAAQDGEVETIELMPEEKAGWSLRNFVQCLEWSTSGFPEGIRVGEDFGLFLTNWKAQLLVSGLFMIGTMGVVYGGIGRGIERVARMLMPFLFVIMAFLLGFRCPRDRCLATPMPDR